MTAFLRRPLRALAAVSLVLGFVLFAVLWRLSPRHVDARYVDAGGQTILLRQNGDCFIGGLRGQIKGKYYIQGDTVNFVLGNDNRLTLQIVGQVLVNPNDLYPQKIWRCREP